MIAHIYLAAVGFVYAVALIVAAFLFLDSRPADRLFASIDPISGFCACLSHRRRFGVSLVAVCMAGVILYYALGLVFP